MHAQPRDDAGRVTATPSVQHTCERCLRRAWKYLKTLAQGQYRVRIYRCACDARLYTHEEIDLCPQPLGKQLGLVRRVQERPCPHCQHQSFYISAHEVSPPLLRRFLYTCCACGATFTTTETAAGQTDGPTPPSERGHRPHPFL